MRVLMFGWEFPPHITGGLGTACFGITKALSQLGDVDVIFVVPKIFGGESDQSVELVAAADVPIFSKTQIKAMQYFPTEYVEISSNLLPYQSPDDFWKQTRKLNSTTTCVVETTKNGKIAFSGKYGHDLINEVFNYALVAKSIAQSKQFDIIHAHDWLTYPAAIAAKQISKKPLVVHVHATEYDRGGGYINPKVYSIERQGMDEADHIVAVSNFTKQIVVSKYDINPKKISVVHNGVEPLCDYFKLNVSKHLVDDKIVTFFGRITAQKGPDYFIEAAYRVLQHVSNVRFVMAGKGDMRTAMLEKVRALGIAHRFVFPGFLHEIEKHFLLSASDVYVMPSVSEPFGIVALEAMQYALPVIVSNQSGVAEIVNHATKVDYFNIDALAKAILKFICDPELSINNGKEAQREAQKHGWDKSASLLREVYVNVNKR